MWKSPTFWSLQQWRLQVLARDHNEEHEPRAKFYESKQNKRDLCNLKEKLSCFRGTSLKLNEYHIIFIITNNWNWNYRIKRFCYVARILKAINSCMFYKKFKKKILKLSQRL